MPPLSGRAIEVRYSRALTDTAGNPAHAATFIRRRLIVLDRALLRNRPEHSRILTHELFHFVWVRLGNPARREWEALLRAEFAHRARGEAGWSAEWRKRALHAADVTTRTRLWREYACESFCDSAASLYSGTSTEVTLGRARLLRRHAWLAKQFQISLPI